MIRKDWTHSGVAKLYTDIQKNGYQILYLTSKAIRQVRYTRDYLKKVEQDKCQLPDGPVIISPDRLLTAFHSNRITDALSYQSVNIPSSRIFTIDTNGEVKLQL
ncbi:13794_t:CDS:2, partial [Funneliformis mosseae]